LARSFCPPASSCRSDPTRYCVLTPPVFAHVPARSSHAFETWLAFVSQLTLREESLIAKMVGPSLFRKEFTAFILRRFSSAVEENAD
ncbi:MAG: hypothetical protein ACK55I_07825, partial [bacterium]